MTDGRAAMGIAPHSGWAAAVVLGTPDANPQVLLRSRIEMVEPDVPDSKQPYHTVEHLDLEQAAQCLRRYEAGAANMAHAAIRGMAAQLASRGVTMTTVGVLDSAGRKGGSLASILASHALIHSADGEHFRQALAAGAERSGLAVRRVRARDLPAQAEEGLRRPSAVLQDLVSAFSRQVGPPWGADQKLAALLAWLLLAQDSHVRRN
jgi:hypothetical protein